MYIITYSNKSIQRGSASFVDKSIAQLHVINNIDDLHTYNMAKLIKQLSIYFIV